MRYYLNFDARHVSALPPPLPLQLLCHIIFPGTICVIIVPFSTYILSRTRQRRTSRNGLTRSFSRNHWEYITQRSIPAVFSLLRVGKTQNAGQGRPVIRACDKPDSRVSRGQTASAPPLRETPAQRGVALALDPCRITSLVRTKNRLRILPRCLRYVQYHSHCRHANGARASPTVSRLHSQQVHSNQESPW